MDRVVANALIFDLDGTVWDSAGWFASGLLGDDVEAVEVMRRELIEGGNIVGALRRCRTSRTRLLKDAELRNGPPPLFAGMADALAELAERGTPLGVATSLPGTLAEPMLQAAGLQGFFGTVVHAGMCRTPKPHPASLQMALRLLDQPATLSAFYVGDRATDAAAAARAGVNFAWVRHGYEKPNPGSKIREIYSSELVKL